MNDSSLYSCLSEWSKKWNIDLGVSNFSKEYIEKVISLIKDRLKTLSDFTTLTSYFFTTPLVDKAEVEKFSTNHVAILKDLLNVYDGISLELWKASNLEKVSHEYIASKGFTPKEAFMTLRIAVTGSTSTPPIFDVLEALGKEVVTNRIVAIISI